MNHNSEKTTCNSIYSKVLGVVILNYNNYSDTINCVNSFCEQGFNDYKIYLIDNASKNESLAVLTEIFGSREDVDISLSPTNGGFSAGNNIGLKKAVADGCKYVLCVNSDVLFKEGCISKLISVLEEDSKCAVVGPKVYCDDGSVQNSNKGILTANVLLLRKQGFRIFDWFGLDKKYTYRNYKYDTDSLIYHRFFCLLAEKDSFLRGGRARCTLPWFQLSHHRTHKNIPKISRRTVPWLNPDSN